MILSQLCCLFHLFVARLVLLKSPQVVFHIFEDGNWSHISVKTRRCCVNLIIGLVSGWSNIFHEFTPSDLIIKIVLADTRLILDIEEFFFSRILL